MIFCKLDFLYQTCSLRRLMSTLLPLLMVAGCSTVVPLTPNPHSAPVSASTTTPVLPAAGSGRGGYYKDDGPGDDIPPGLQNLPDAVPRIGPYSLTGNKPYVVFGKTYTPMTDDKPFTQRGTASWYGKKFHNHRTSSGEVYDMYQMTAAHPTLPIPSYARLTNLKNGKQVIVRINDRGPFHSTRIIDVSYAAALRLGYLGSGSSQVEVERLLPADILAINKSAKVTDPADAVAIMAVESGVVQSTELEPVAQPVSLPSQINAASPALAQNPVQGYYLQLGAFSVQPNAELERQRLMAKLPGIVSMVDDVAVGGIYRLYAGPYTTRLAAEAAATLVKARALISAIIVLR